MPFLVFSQYIWISRFCCQFPCEFTWNNNNLSLVENWFPIVSGHDLCSWNFIDTHMSGLNFFFFLRKAKKATWHLILFFTCWWDQLEFVPSLILYSSLGNSIFWIMNKKRTRQLSFPAFHFPPLAKDMQITCHKRQRDLQCLPASEQRRVIVGIDFSVFKIPLAAQYGTLGGAWGGGK